MLRVIAGARPRTRIASVVALTAALALLLAVAGEAAAFTVDAPDSPFETRGATPVTIKVVTDTPGENFSANGAIGTVGAFVVSGNEATATYTAANGFAGADNFTVYADNGVDSANVPVTVVVRPPTALLSGPGVGPTAALTNVAAPTFTFESRVGTALVGDAAFRCKVDSGSFAACNSGSYTTPTLSDGPHTLTVRAQNAGGLNVDNAPPTVDFTVDTTAPTINVDSGPNTTIGPNSASFGFTAGSDPNGAVTTACRLITPTVPNPSFTTCSSPKSYSSLEEGAHTFEVRATDTAGNSNTASRSFTVQDTAPVANDATRSTEGTAPISEAATDADGDTLSYSIVTPAANGTASPTASGVTYTANSTFAGVDSFEYLASDGRGGTDSATVTVTVTPQETITADPGTTTGVGRPAWSFSSTQTTTFECQLAPSNVFDVNTGTWTSCTSPYQPPSNLADGTYTFGVRATSGALVDPTPSTHTVTVANGASGITPQTFSTEGTAPVSASVGPAQDPDGDPLTYDLSSSPTLGSLDGGTALPAFVYTADGDKAGVDTFNVHVVDGRGSDETIPVTVRVAPPTSITGTPGSPTADATPTWEFSSPVPGAGFECRVDAGSWESCDSGSFAPGAPLADGARTFEVRATKGGVADPTPASSTVTVDTASPTVNITGPANGNTSARPDVSWSSPEDPDVAYRCRLFATDTAVDERPAFDDCDSPVTLPFLARVTQYSFEVEATDTLGNTGVTAHTWNQSNTPPSASDHNATVQTGGTVTIGIVAGDGDGDDLTYSIASQPSGGTLDETALQSGSVDYTADSDYAGHDSFTYTVTDGRENGTVTKTVSVDVTPDTAFATTPPAETNDTTPTWTFTSPVAGAGFQCTLDTDAPVACDSGTFTPSTDLPEGPHTLTVAATFDGLSDQTPVTDTVTVDTTAPDVSITATPNALSNDRTPAFQYTSTDGSATFECAVDSSANEDFHACASGDSTASLADGDHTFYVRAVDPGTNRTDPPASYTWEVDGTAPVVALGGVPVGETNGPGPDGITNAKKPRWYFTSSDAAGHLISASARCRVDSGPVTSTCLSPYQPASNLSDGTHTLTVELDDTAGNTGTLSVTFKVDTVAPPGVVITEAPDNPSGKTAKFAFSAEAGATFMCRVTGTAGQTFGWRACTSPETLTDLSSGTRTFQVKALDAGGNESPVASHTWRAVGTTPDTSITAKPADGTTATTAGFGLASDDVIATFECRLDGGAWSGCTHPAAYTVAVGAHTFEVRAVNEVGVKDPTPATWTWTVAAPPPPPADPTPPTTTTTTTTPATTTPDTGGGGGPTTPQQTCTAIAAKTKSAGVTIAKGVSLTVSLSHSSARVGQTVTVSSTKPKDIDKLVTQIRVLDGSKVLATLKRKKWSATFKPGTTGKRKLTIQVVRKTGKPASKSITLGVEKACS